MSNKKEEIINNEEEVKAAVEETDKEVEAKEESKKAKNESSKAKLKVLVAFTDKYTEEKYKINSVISVSKERAEELLKDKRKLVEKQN